MNQRIRYFVLCTAAVLAVTMLTPVCQADETFTDSILGNRGEVYLVQSGAYAELFPEGDAADPEAKVLALDVVHQGGRSERLAVPETFGPGTESDPKLVYSQVGDALNVVWTSRREGHASLLLVRLQDEVWSAVETLYSGPGTVPDVTLTRDALYFERGDGQRAQAESHVLHLFWMDDSFGLPEAVYRPVLLFNGVFVGGLETLPLPHLDANPNEASWSTLPGSLWVEADGDTVTVTFGSSRANRLTTYQIAVTPMEFLHLGTQVSEFVRGSEFDPSEISHFADLLGTHIAGMGARRFSRSRLNVPVMEYVAAQIEGRLLETAESYTAEQIEELAGDLGSYTIEVARSLFSPASSQAKSGRITKNGNAPGSVLEIDVSDLFGSDMTAAAIHFLDIRYATEWALPEVEDAEMTFFASPDGSSIVVAWTDAMARKLWYSESRLGDEGGWSSPRFLPLGERFSLSDAAQLLRERIE